MELKTQNNEITIIWLLIGVFSAWGGFVRYINDNKKTNVRWNWRKILEQIIVSSFSGVLSGFICFESGVSLYATLVLSGLFGTMGNSGVDFIKKRILNQRGRK